MDGSVRDARVEPGRVPAERRNIVYGPVGWFNRLEAWAHRYRDSMNNDASNDLQPPGAAESASARWLRAVIELAIGMAVSPSSATRRLGTGREVRGGLMVTVVVCSAIGFVAFGTALIGDGAEQPGLATAAVMAAGAAAAGVAGVGFAPLIALCLHLSASAVGGSGRFRAMYSVVGFASVTGIVLIPALVLADGVGRDLGSTVRDAAVAVSIGWWTTLVARGIKEVYATPWRAIPGALILALIGIAFALLVLIAVLSFVALLVVMLIVP